MSGSQLMGLVGTLSLPDDIDLRCPWLDDCGGSLDGSVGMMPLLIVPFLDITLLRADLPAFLSKSDFTCRTFAEAVNHYVALGEEAAVKNLLSLASDRGTDFNRMLHVHFSFNHRIGLLCRVLFEPK